LVAGMILMGKFDKYSHNLEIKTKVDKWNEPLYRILTGHEDLRFRCKKSKYLIKTLFQQKRL